MRIELVYVPATEAGEDIYQIYSKSGQVDCSNQPLHLQNESVWLALGQAVSGWKILGHVSSAVQGPRSKFSSGGAKEECVKEIFFSTSSVMLLSGLKIHHH